MYTCDRRNIPTTTKKNKKTRMYLIVITKILIFITKKYYSYSWQFLSPSQLLIFDKHFLEQI